MLKIFLLSVLFISFISAEEEKVYNNFALVTMMKTGTHMTKDLLAALTQRHFVYIGDMFKIPRSGKGDENFFTTKLINRFIRYLNTLDRTQRFTYSHTADYFIPFGIYADSHPDFLLITNSRDLRDVVVSLAYHLEKENYFKNFYPDQKLTLQEKLMHSIKSMNSQVMAYFELVKRENVHIVRFEDLVGEKGGGSDKAQMDLILNLSKKLGLKLDHLAIKKIVKHLYGTSATFRKGEIGEWKTHFDEELKIAFKTSLLGTALIEMGYEEDMDW